jgi:hypothetical protein
MDSQGLGSPTSVAPPTETPTSRFIKKLNEYKELIGFVIFVIAGIFWAFAYFATKQQLTELKCLMNANISIIQGKTDSANLSQLLLQNQQDLAAVEAKTSLTPAEILQRDRLTTAANDIGRRLADANTLTAQSLTKLTSGQCSGD